MTEHEKKVIKMFGPDAMLEEYETEAEVLKQVKIFLKYLGNCVVVREANPVLAGTSDLLICYKGKFVAIELKSHIGEPTMQQIGFIEQVKRSGGNAGVCRSLKDVWTLLCSTTS